MSNHFDTIVIGIGSMGSATCWHLAQRGLRVLGIEQFTSPHENGSHTGQSRIIRKAYFEHPDYVPLLQRAYELWRKFEEVSKAKLFYKTGIVYAGKPDNENMKGVLSSASLYDIPIKQYSIKESRTQFPLLKIPNDFITIFEDDAGFITPEQTIDFFIRQAKKSEATILQNEIVKEWKHQAGKIKVITNRKTYTSDKLVITAGSWTSKLIPQLQSTLKVTEQLLAWVHVSQPKKFSLGNFPCWFIEDPDLGTFYGFPILPGEKFSGPSGFKLAHHSPGVATDPDKRSASIPADFETKINYVLEKYIPEAKGKIMASKSCLYTYSADNHFIIDHLPGHDNKVMIACGFSGHGFKFVPVIGEILSDLVMKNSTELPIEFLRLSRFAANTSIP